MSPFGSKREESREVDEARTARDATQEVRWEYLARNLQKVAGMAPRGRLQQARREGLGVRCGGEGLRDLQAADPLTADRLGV